MTTDVLMGGPDLQKQAHLFAHYITGLNDVQPTLVKRYASFMDSTAPQHRDPRLLEIALKYPFLLPSIDGYCALFDPNNELRRRLYYMFAIIEAAPDHSDKFLSKQRSWVYLLALGIRGLRAAFRVIIGGFVYLLRGVL
jgi:hypothetical protein